MKTERRHELQTNQLADSLGHWIEAVRPYKRLAAGLAIAGLVLACSVVYVSAKTAQKMEDGWNEYFEAFNAGDKNKLDDTAEKYANTPVAYWSRLVAADIRLNDGIGQLFKDRGDGREELRRAAEDYELVYKQARDPMLKQRALFGLARANESLGELEEATEHYKTVVKNWPDGAYAAVAERRAADLEKDSTKKFYDWFARYEPPSMTGAVTPGVKPDFTHESLDNPDIKLPSVVNLPSAEPGATTKPEETIKKEETAKTDEPGKKEEPAPESKPEDKPEASPAPSKPDEPAAPSKPEPPAAPEEKKESKPDADVPPPPKGEDELKAGEGTPK